MQIVGGGNLPTSASTCPTSPLATASRLRLNPTKTHVMWLGSKHQSSKITNRDVPIISSLLLVLQGNVATKLSYGQKFFILVMSH